MESTERFAKARVRLDKAEQCISRIALCKKLSERVFRDAAELEARLIDAIRIGLREAEMADKKADQMAKVLKRSGIIMSEIEVANESYRMAMADPEKLVENVEDSTIDEFLDGALARIEKSQNELETQIFELQAIGVELDRVVNKKSVQS